MSVTARLKNERKAMEQLCQQTSLIRVLAEGDAPTQYHIEYSCKGLDHNLEISTLHIAKIILGPEYPYEPPHVSLLTPVFHPNIAAAYQLRYVRQHLIEAMESAPSEEERQQILTRFSSNPETFEGHVCLDTLNKNWSPQISLVPICLELGEMIQLKRYNIRDPLNGEAADWVQANEFSLPVDTRSLVDIKKLETIQVIEEDQPPEVAIKIISSDSLD